MKASWILATAVAMSVHLATEKPLAAGPLAPGPSLPRPAPIFTLVQGAAPVGDVELRITRLWRNREIIENALQPSREAAPAVPPIPRARALQPPDPVISTGSAMSCGSAAAVVAEYGFSEVREQDCSSDLYRFSAVRDGTAYSIGVTAATGEIAEVSRE